MKDAATTVMERCELLENISKEPGLLVRPYGSQANGIVADWMHDAGMTTRRDSIGNLIGRYEGTGEKTLILGSHLDTVRDAGKYDDILGVMVALACVQQLHNRGERLPFSIEVAAYADEEGLRFGATFLGSSVYAGAFDRERLKLEDKNGVTLREAVCAFGGDADALESDGRGGDDLLGYREAHIEQGPVLEEEDLPVGVVTAINGQSRIRVGFVGKAGHSRRCEFSWEVRQETPAVPADLDLSALLGSAVEESGLPVYRLPSGAGHDAAQMAALTPIAMLFVRCKEGISHNPAKSVKKEDVAVAIEVMSRFLRLMVESELAGERRDTGRATRA